MSLSGGVTPGRKTQLRLLSDPGFVRVRSTQRMSRRADQMSRADSKKYGASSSVRHVPGSAWILDPMEGDLSRLTTTQYGAEALNATNCNLAPGYVSKELWAKPTMTGIVTGSGLATTGIPAFVKRVEGDDWGAGNLASDLAACPKPPLLTEIVRMDRVLVSTTTFPPNKPFALRYHVNRHQDNLLNFYFGGATDTEVEGQEAGRFCLNLRSDGSGTLFERDGETWEQRFRAELDSPGQAPEGPAALVLIPYGTDKLVLLSPRAQTPQRRAGGVVEFAEKSAQLASLYVDSLSSAGHQHKFHLTGAGVVRCDRAQNDRSDFSIIPMPYSTGGTLIDAPWHLNVLPVEGDRIDLKVHAEIPAGCTLTTTVYDAESKDPLATDEDGWWLLNAGQRSYYIAFDLTSDGVSTPAIYDWEWEYDGTDEVSEPVEILVDLDRQAGLTVEAGGLDFLTGHAELVVNDLTGDAEILGQRGRIRAQVVTANGEGVGRYSVLFDGETQPDGIDAHLEHQLGVGPYNAYHVGLTPLGGRLADVYTDKLVDKYLRNAPDQVLGITGLPWLIGDIVVDLFHYMGVTDDYLDVPDSFLESGALDGHRLWLGGSNRDDMAIQACTRVIDVLQHFVRDYLDGYIVRDPNAGKTAGHRGMWRVLRKPAAPYTALAEFRATPPETGWSGRAVEHWQVGVSEEGAVATYISRSAPYSRKIIPPECNMITVVGTGGQLGDGVAQQMVQQTLWNPASFNLDPANPTATDPTHPDRLDGMVRAIYVDPLIQGPKGQETANYMCRRIYDRASHGKQRHSFRAPLILVWDDADPYQLEPRPLRQGDVVKIPTMDLSGMQFGIVTAPPRLSVPQGDSQQWADYQVVAVDPLLEEWQWAWHAQELENAAVRALAAQAVGVSSHKIKVFSRGALTGQQVNAILSLPLNTEGYAPIQGDGGQLYFIPGISNPDGLDLLV